MQFLGSFFTFLIVSLVFAAMVAFGFMVFAWVMMVATLVYIYVILRRAWFRWRGVSEPPPVALYVIEGDYKDISNN